MAVFNFGKIEGGNGKVILVLPNDVIFKLYRMGGGKMGKKDYKRDKLTVDPSELQ